MSEFKKVLFVFVLAILVLGLVGRMWDTIKKQKAEIQRLDRNVDALTSSEAQYLTKIGDAAVKRKALELSSKELKTVNADLYREVSNLKVRMKDVQSVTKIQTHTEIVEVVKTDTVGTTLVAEYKDNYNTIRAKVTKDTTQLSYIGSDSLVGAISIRQKRFLFFRWGIKNVEYDVSNKNPKSSININLAVKLK